MKRFKKLYLILTLGLSLLALPVRGETPEQLVNKFVSSFKGNTGITASFVISSQNKSVKGTFQSSGKKFYITTPQSSVWYNGTYMWTYNPSSRETTRVKPDASELAQTNPLVYLSNHAADFKPTMGKSSSAGEKVVILTPKSKNNEVSRAVLTLDAAGTQPKKLAVRMGNDVVTIQISSFKKGVKLAATAFEYPKSKYPNIKIIDL